MAAVPPRTEGRRPRPGSLERPVNGRLYRGTWLLVGLPLLVAAFAVARPTPLPSAFLPSFDEESAAQLARDLAHTHPDRFPGTPDALGAEQWFRDQLEPYGLRIRSERFDAVIPGHGRVPLENLIVSAVGRSPRTIVVVAHRDDDGRGRGANDNASGTAALIELARTYAAPGGTSPGAGLHPNHTIIFLSTDGGAFGGLGAAHFLRHSPLRHDVAAVLNLDTIAGRGRVRLEIAGDTPRSPSGTLLETVAARIAKQTGRPPARASALGQLIDLGFPFSVYEQAPFVARGIGAVTITTAGDTRIDAVSDTPDRLDTARFGEVGRATQDILGTLDQGLEFAQGTSSYVYLGSRLLRGWAVELVLIACLLPFFAAAVDLFARCRRRRIPLAPALRAYRSRAALWLWVVIVFEFFDVLGFWPGGTARPLSTASAAARDWPAAALFGVAVLALAGWLVERERLIPRRNVTLEEELAGHTAAMLCLAALALLVVATNPFALLFLLPSLHVWLWLPHVRRSGWPARIALLAVGFVGPLLVLGSFAWRYGLGWDAPWYVLELRALGYVSFATMLFGAAWLAAAAQLTAISVGRYAPYASAAERPPRGPIRRVIRRAVLAVRHRRRASEQRPAALEL